jgi:hypothetical protein
MTEDDRSYLMRRARDESAAAAAATYHGAAHIHARLAAEYSRRLEAMPAQETRAG